MGLTSRRPARGQLCAFYPHPPPPQRRPSARPETDLTVYRLLASSCWLAYSGLGKPALRQPRSLLFRYFCKIVQLLAVGEPGWVGRDCWSVPNTCKVKREDENVLNCYYQFSLLLLMLSS